MEEKKQIIKYPKPLENGDAVGITAPSMAFRENLYKRLDNAILNLENAGFKVIETSNVRNKTVKWVSSSASMRANELMDLWKNEEVKWIIAASGGEFLIEMIPYIDKDIIKGAKPKWVQGFSDVSLLNFYLTTNFNIATVHFESISDFGMKDLDISVINNIDILRNTKNEQSSFEAFEVKDLKKDENMELTGYNLTEKVEYKHLYGKKEEMVEGRLIRRLHRCTNSVNWYRVRQHKRILWAVREWHAMVFRKL
ncbi:MAG: LD-carboxypeptidase [Lachnospiraceae bacterium]|jgi:muramoyltetrapeptide carboxypeptidase LdcA involved in peptidoglycan recycling|nr:LD-carboxypeptidase [Lachnospiraceae bacterium]